MIKTYYPDWYEENMCRADGGDWVHLDDHKAIVKDLQSRLGELNQKVDELEKENASLKPMAARYRWLREQHWSYKGMCVVAKAENVKLGSFCPSTDLLDATIDAAIQSETQ